MTPDDRSAISAKLTAASALIAELNDTLVRGCEARQLLRDVDALHDRAAETLAIVVGLTREDGEMAFVGANVAIGAERTAEEDKASQFAYERGERRAG